MFKTIEQKVSAEIVEKKSRFIANVFYVVSVEEAEAKIKEISKEHFSARHHCYAYRIYTENGIISKASDDGEPSGTAGAPILNILTTKEMSNVLVIVTRYFGGILLGTGGLVRAYTGATIEALGKAKEIQKVLGFVVKLQTTYSDLEKFKYYLKQHQIPIIEINFGEIIELIVEMTEEELEKIENTKGGLHFKVLTVEVITQKYITTENAK